MAEITASLVKELRERTGAGMMDCKKALTEANGDIELAIENMRKSGAIKAWTLLPGVDAATRTLQLRLEVDNADEALKPGMNAWLQLNTASEPMLLIPSQALIDTGHKFPSHQFGYCRHKKALSGNQSRH